MGDIFSTNEYGIFGDPTTSDQGGESDFNPDDLPTSTNTPSDSDVILVKESSTWYQKAFSKVWDYIKSKIQSSSNEVAYGTCTTAAATVAKVVTLQDAGNWKLKKGTVIAVKFTNTNTAQNPTLNVNNSGAKSIYYNTSQITTGSLWTAGESNRYTTYMYDGTYWVWVGSSVDRNTTYSAMSVSELLAGTATTSRLMRADYTKASIEALSTSCGTCTTVAATAAKVVTLEDDNWVLRVGAEITVKFTYTNTAQNPTLNVNGTGAKSVYYNTSVITTGSLATAGTANRYIKYIYDGTYWVWIGQGIDNNTTYSSMSKSELTTGTATTSRVVRADYLKSAILDLANPIGTVIESTTCDTMAKVVEAYGGTTWIQHTGYMLRGATSGVVANQASNDGGADSVTVSSVASHNHTQDRHNHTSYGSTEIGSGQCQTTSYSNGNNAFLKTGGIAKLVSDTTATNKANGSNYTVSTLPKYKNVYIWERTA